MNVEGATHAALGEALHDAVIGTPSSQRSEGGAPEAEPIPEALPAFDAVLINDLWIVRGEDHRPPGRELGDQTVLPALVPAMQVHHVWRERIELAPEGFP